MKIGFDGRFIRPNHSGNGVFSQLLLENLARLDHANEYTVYLLEDDSFIKQDNFHLKRMPALHASSHLRFLLTFPLELMQNPVDIFHGVYSVPLRTPKRVVLTMVEFSWFLNPGDFPASWLFLAQLRLMTRHAIRRATRVITPTRLGKVQLLEYFDLPDEKVEVIPFGLNEFFLETCALADIQSVKQRYGIKQEYILNVGDLHPRKNLVRLIEAFRWLKESKKIPHQLVLVGKGLLNPEEIYRSATACSIPNSIIFTGYVPLKDLRALYQGADLFVFPSLDEGFGIPVHEAMASRVPVIISDRGALPEVAGDAALVVDPLETREIGQTMFQLLDSTSLAQELVDKGLEQIKSFSWENSCRSLIRLYKNISS